MVHAEVAAMSRLMAKGAPLHGPVLTSFGNSSAASRGFVGRIPDSAAACTDQGFLNRGIISALESATRSKPFCLDLQCSNAKAVGWSFAFLHGICCDQFG